PFNPCTTIKYQIPSNVKGETSNVKLIVYDVLGREVAMLVNKEQKPGSYEVVFDARNLTSGVYYYQLRSDSFYKTRKMILLK
ncbi:MAG: T9SS type A sorting domain-containing protein, partial [Bacteroidota bacterium]